LLYRNNLAIEDGIQLKYGKQEISARSRRSPSNILSS
jgi:hypothetical protein